MSSKKQMDDGLMVMGSKQEHKYKDLGAMSHAMQVRHRYVDKDGKLTERGWDRATTRDYASIEAYHQHVLKARGTRSDK